MPHNGISSGSSLYAKVPILGILLLKGLRMLVLVMQDSVWGGIIEIGINDIFVDFIKCILLQIIANHN